LLPLLDLTFQVRIFPIVVIGGQAVYQILVACPALIIAFRLSEQEVDAS